ncbi:hypothetical protein GDO78_003536 [Eleutherodactylus coqui]|uniref:Beta,beta-carotene 15,15'-dioxygenase n=1 Tax=Eleutherodactylus coqui TaxID=57060 RepID=A0A8J6EUD8_ELECQ|nr:hypothetical protein GDO78_003536 [Eleutherodactylus coqui]
MESTHGRAESVLDVIFCKTRQECPEPIKAEVQGSIPKWLQGTLLRNGPGLHAVGEMTYNHWFDGLSLIHSFTMKNGKAFTYLSHVVPEFTDNCLINIIKFGDDYYTSSETNFIRKIDPYSLDTLEKVDYMKYVTVNLATSHPHYDNEGNTFNMGTSIGDKGRTKYMIFKVPSTVADKDKKKSPLKSAEVVCAIPARHLLSPSYYHSFGMTENYIILIEQPLKLDIVKLATAYFRGVNWASCIVFQNDEKTWFHIVDKRTKKPVAEKFYSDALVFYHHINAYEEDGHIVFDIIAYKDNSLYDMFYMANLRKTLNLETVLTSAPTCKRFVVPLQYDKKAEVGVNLVKIPTTATAVKDKNDEICCHPEILCEGIELPRINYDYNGKKYRYVYASHVEWRPIPTQIVKFDTVTKEMLVWNEDMCWPAEPLFVPDPNGKEEDDGIILSSIVSSDPKKSSFLLILDAKTFKEVGRASVNANIHVDLHGIFIPDNNCAMK